PACERATVAMSRAENPKIAPRMAASLIGFLSIATVDRDRSDRFHPIVAGRGVRTTAHGPRALGTFVPGLLIHAARWRARQRRADAWGLGTTAQVLWPPFDLDAQLTGCAERPVRFAQELPAQEDRVRI